MSLELALFKEAFEDPYNIPPPVVVTNPVLAIHAVTACTCGCHQPAGIVLEIGSARAFVTDPMLVDAITDQVAAYRAQLWGPRP